MYHGYSVVNGQNANSDIVWTKFIGPIDKAVEGISKRLKTCVKAGGGHFKHSQWQWNSDILSLVNWLCCLNDVIKLVL